MLVLHHDFTSAASAVAVWRLQRLADEGFDVGFSGIEVIGLDIGVPASATRQAEQRAAVGAAAELGLRLAPRRLLPPTLGAHLVATVADRLGLSTAWRLGCYRAFWEDGVDLGDAAMLTSLAVAHGLPRDPVTELLADRAARTALRRRMATRRGQGIGGVPVLDLDGTLCDASIPDAELRALATL